MSKHLCELVKGDRVTVVNTDGNNIVVPLAVLVVDAVGAREVRTLPRSPGQDPERWLVKSGHKPGAGSYYRGAWIRATEDSDADLVTHAKEHEAVREAEKRVKRAADEQEKATRIAANWAAEEVAAIDALALAKSALENARKETPS